MGEPIGIAAIPDKHNKKADESEVCPEGASGATEDLDEEASAHPYANIGEMDEEI